MEILNKQSKTTYKIYCAPLQQDYHDPATKRKKFLKKYLYQIPVWNNSYGKLQQNGTLINEFQSFSKLSTGFLL